MKFKVILFIIFLSLPISFAIANEITLTVKVNKKRITIGEKILLSITLMHPQNKNYQLPLLDKKVGVFEIEDYFISKSTNAVNNQKQFTFKTVNYQITSYALGEQVIPELTYRIDNQNIKSKPLVINIESVLTSDKEELQDLKANLLPYEPISYWFYAILFITILILLLAFYLLFKLISRKKEKPFYDLAEFELDRLMNENSNNIINKVFYFKLDKIIKNFFSFREKKRSILSMTSKEIKEYFNIQKEHNTFANQYFDYADTIKFSSHQPDPLITEKLISDFKEIILNTKELEEKKQNNNKP